MACPNTEDGFVMISLELGAALAMARLTTAEQVIVWEVVSRTYGPAKAPLAAISATDLARRTGLDRTFLAKGLRSLLDSGILAEGKERGEYKLQKNYDRWDRSAHKESDESARARRDYARAAVKAARSYPKQAPPECGNTATVGCGDIATVADSGCGNTATVSVAILPQSCGNTATPILLVDSLDLRETPPSPPQGGETTTIEPPAEAKTEEPAATVAFPGVRANHRVKPGKHVVDEAELIRAAAFIEREFTEKNRDYAFTCGLYEASENYPTDWFLKALINARVQEKRSGELIGRFRYVTNILDRWKDNGGPIHGDWADYDEMLNLRDPAKHKAAFKRRPGYGQATEVKPVPLPPEVKAPADWEQRAGVPNPYSKNGREKSA